MQPFKCSAFLVVVAAVALHSANAKGLNSQGLTGLSDGGVFAGQTTLGNFGAAASAFENYGGSTNTRSVHLPSGAQYSAYINQLVNNPKTVSIHVPHQVASGQQGNIIVQERTGAIGGFSGIGVGSLPQSDFNAQIGSFDSSSASFDSFGAQFGSSFTPQLDTFSAQSDALNTRFASQIGETGFNGFQQQSLGGFQSQISDAAAFPHPNPLPLANNYQQHIGTFEQTLPNFQQSTFQQNTFQQTVPNFQQQIIPTIQQQVIPTIQQTHVQTQEAPIQRVVHHHVFHQKPVGISAESVVTKVAQQQVQPLVIQSPPVIAQKIITKPIIAAPVPAPAPIIINRRVTVPVQQAPVVITRPVVIPAQVQQQKIEQQQIQQQQIQQQQIQQQQIQQQQIQQQQIQQQQIQQQQIQQQQIQQQQIQQQQIQQQQIQQQQIQQQQIQQQQQTVIQTQAQIDNLGPRLLPAIDLTHQYVQNQAFDAPQYVQRATVIQHKNQASYAPGTTAHQLEGHRVEDVSELKYSEPVKGLLRNSIQTVTERNFDFGASDTVHIGNKSPQIHRVNAPVVTAPVIAAPVHQVQQVQTVQTVQNVATQLSSPISAAAAPIAPSTEDIQRVYNLVLNKYQEKQQLEQQQTQNLQVTGPQQFQLDNTITQVQRPHHPHIAQSPLQPQLVSSPAGTVRIHHSPSTFTPDQLRSQTRGFRSTTLSPNQLVLDISREEDQLDDPEDANEVFELDPVYSKYGIRPKSVNEILDTIKRN